MDWHLLLFNTALLLAIFSLALAIYWRVTQPASPVDERLKEINPRVSQELSPPQVSKVIVEHVAKPISQLVPPSPRNVRRLRRRLIRAGFLSENAVFLYSAIRLASAIFFPTVTLVALIITRRAFDASAVALLLIAVGFGLYLPSFVLSHLVTRRQKQIVRALPDALDLMVVCVEAGLGLNAALQRVGREMELVESALAYELMITNREIRAGKPRDEALRNLGDRTGIDDLKSLIAMLIQSDRFGTSIADSLRVFADSLRTKRRQRAEELVSKATIKLIFPLLLFIFPALLIVLLGPALIIMYGVLSQLAE